MTFFRGMFGNLVKSFMRQVVIIRANIIPKKLYNISEISTMLLLNYQTKVWTKFTQDNKSRDGWTDNNRDKKPWALTTRIERKKLWTFFLSGQKGK